MLIRPRHFLVVAFLSFIAFAQDIPAPTLPPSAVPGMVSPDDNLVAALSVVVQLAQEGRVLPAVLAALFLAVWATRKLAKYIPGAVGTWLRSKMGGYVVNFALAALGGFGSLAYKGMPLTLGNVLALLGAAVTFAFGASGLNEFIKDLGSKWAPAVEAPKVETTEQAVTEFNKVGPPAP